MFKSLFQLVLCITIIIHNGSGSGINFLFEPQDSMLLTPGETTTLNCKAELQTPTGNKPASIKWRNLNEKDVLRYGTQLSNGSLVLTNLFVNVEDTRQLEEFQCIASIENIGTAVSKVASIRLAKIPDFVQPVTNVSITVGQMVHFPCFVNPETHVKIAWLKNKRHFFLDDSRMLVLPSGTLEIEDVNLADSGMYQCNVSVPELGQFKLSNEAYLSVNAPTDASTHTMPPTFVSKPQNLVVRAEDNVTLDCAANGNPRPEIIWLKDGIEIDLGVLDSRFSKIGVGSLQINDVKEEDEGDFVCRAVNREDSVDASASLQVQVPPKFTKLPEDLHAYSKEDVELQCHVSGKPQPKVVWLKNGERINQNYFQIGSNNNLRIQGTLKLDSGVFQCLASNVAGNVQRSSLLIISDRDDSSTSSSLLNRATSTAGSSLIYDTGSIESKNESTVLPSSPQTLSAIMVGPRSVALRWSPPLYARGEVQVYCVIFKKNGSERERIYNTTSRAEEAIIQGLQPNVTYHFRVVAYNEKGAGKASAELIVRTESEDHVPSPPLNLMIQSVSSTSMLVTWEKPMITNGVIKHYTLYYLEEDTSVERHVVTSDLAYELTGLSTYTMYTLWVVAYNFNGAGTTSMEISVQTLSDKPAEPPSNVTVEASGTSSVTVKWQPPPKKGQNGVITGYKIRYRKRDKKDKGETVTTAGDRRLYMITELNKNTVYQIKVWAMNVNGSGPATEWLPVETFENDLGEDTVPDEPAMLKARATTATSIYVSWSPPPSENKIMVRGYTIGWGKGVPDVFEKKILDVKQRHFEITGLEPNADYVIRLRAFNDLGDGPPKYENLRTRSEPVFQVPKNLIPPIGLKSVVLSPYSINVSWIDTTVPEQFQYGDTGRHYVVRYTHRAASYPRYKYANTSDTSVVISDLRPSMQYEFTVKVIRGIKESEWSMIELNTTFEAAPTSAPRDLTVVPKDDDPTSVNLNWQPPKMANGQISGYCILYTNDLSSAYWMEENVVGDKMSTNIKGLQAGTTYYFRIKALNSAGNSPLSSVKTLTTFAEKGGALTNTMILYTIIACCVLLVVYVIVVILVLCCCRMNSSAERSKKGYVKGNTGGKQTIPTTHMNPPDLWIHHDQMELKALEKSSQGSLDTAPTPSVQPQPEYDPPKIHHNVSTPSSSNSLDKQRAFTTSYITMNQPSHNNSETRPLYPRSQYSVSRAHVTIDPSAGAESAYVVHSQVDAPGPPASCVNYGNAHAQPHNTSTTDNSSSAPKVKRQGHPLKSFTVPAPPPTSSAPTTPQQKHIVTVRPQSTSSPYKKSSQSSLWPASVAENPELTPLKPSYSTEELTQEMANLEGLMKDLDAITASEFKC